MPFFVRKISGLVWVYALCSSGWYFVIAVLVAAIVALVAGRWVLSDAARTERLAALIEAVCGRDRRTGRRIVSRRGKRGE